VISNDDPTEGHARFHELNAAVREGRPDDDAALLATLLAEPDRLMVESLLASLVDTRAEGPGSAASFAAWAELVLDAVGADGFIARRVQEWGLFKALQSGAPVDREALAAATNWLQRCSRHGRAPRAPLMCVRRARRGTRIVADGWRKTSRRGWFLVCWVRGTEAVGFVTPPSPGRRQASTTGPLTPSVAD
jgi:hypothetical protein